MAVGPVLDPGGWIDPPTLLHVILVPILSCRAAGLWLVDPIAVVHGQHAKNVVSLLRYIL